MLFPDAVRCLPGVLWHDSATRSVLTTLSPDPVVYGTKNRKNKVKIGEKVETCPKVVHLLLLGKQGSCKSMLHSAGEDLSVLR